MARRIAHLLEEQENVGQLRGGVNQLLLCLNNYIHFLNLLQNFSMMITINKQVEYSTSITHMYSTETDIPEETHKG
jgi:hypothetical protein